MSELKEIIFYIDNQSDFLKKEHFTRISDGLKEKGYSIINFNSASDFINTISSHARAICGVFDWDYLELSKIEKSEFMSKNFPLIAFTEKHYVIDLNKNDFNFNIEFLQYSLSSVKDHIYFIEKMALNYIQNILPPFTKSLFEFDESHKYTFCTPGHLGGTAFQKSPIGVLFYDFFGENVFKTDISISVPELGSLLDHTGPHKEAEELIAKTFGADRSYIVTNGTSTANKIVAMYAASKGDTILVDRNCHKSICHYMMMTDVNPIYLKPTRNAYGILGGIPKSEFSTQSIQNKIENSSVAKNWPSYAVITNSTYDGIFYNTEYIANELDIKNIHFDGAWIPYAHFNSIYSQKHGMDVVVKKEKTIIETQSTHKLLAAFSQGSMIHMKGEINHSLMDECFMMHTSTSPLYSIVASCETSAAIMAAECGKKMLQESIDYAVKFRDEIKKIQNESTDWFFDVWQPNNSDKTECWEIKPQDNWHGFLNMEDNFLFLDPIKVTILTPGIENMKLSPVGIPADIVSKYLNENGIVVEKTGPYNLLFLFSIGIDSAKSFKLLSTLMKFKNDFDANLKVREMIPSLFNAYPEYYKNMRIQDLSKKMHALNIKYDLPNLMYKAFDVLPEVSMNPNAAFQNVVKNKIETVKIADIVGKISANMILPYPPGVPLIMPGEKITNESRDILDYLLLLESIGKEIPGFSTDIHGVETDEEGNLLAKVLKE